MGEKKRDACMTTEEARVLAEAHWEWVETWLRLVYVDAFIHGAKHADDAAREEGRMPKP